MGTPTPTAFRSVRRDASLSDKVVGQLTEAIMSRQLVPGQRLPSERELGEQFGVSRTVIREAIRSLAARGLVNVTSGRGIEVGKIDSGDVTTSMRLFVRGHSNLHYGKVHEVRTAVEVQTAGLAAVRATPEDIARLQELCDAFRESIAAGDLPKASELDFQFHQELARASGNELLLAMLDSIADVLREVRSQAMVHAGVAEAGLKAHRWILQCISAGDPESARRAMEKHLAEAEQHWRGKWPPRPGEPSATATD
jgi:GntR family transcriptional regulator, transcriptional repressor for pyruvate dehydrogenase complex